MVEPLLVGLLAVWGCENPIVRGDDPLATHPLFDISAIGNEDGFYDYPFPSDLRVTPTGAPALSNFYEPVTTPLLQGLRDDIGRDTRGASQSGGVYFRFSSALDAESLPPSPAESLEPGSTAYFVDIDDASPRRGQRWPAEVTFYEDGGRYYMPNMVVVRPPAGMPLWPNTRYAAVVARGTRDLDGREVAAATEFRALVNEEAPIGREAEWEAMRPLVRWASRGDFLDDILVASVFTTADHVGDMRRLRRWIYQNRPRPHASEWIQVHGPEETGYALYTGRFELLEFFAGDPPYEESGTGVILFDDGGDPIPGRDVSARFALTVPAGDPPEGGWPLALYSHGAGGDALDFADTEGRWAAEVGVAMVSMDNPMHGDRDPTGVNFVDYLVGLAITNIAAGRDMYRHGIVDQIQLTRLAWYLAVPAEVSHSGEPISLDAVNLAFTSHSMGSQIGTMLVGVERDVRSAFFSAGGGSAVAALLFRKANGVDIEELVALVLGVDIEREPLTADHPVVGLIIQTLLDPGDPMSYAYGAIRDPEGLPVSIAMTEGLEDDQTVPISVEGLAAAYGLPIVVPVSQPSAAHDLWGIGAEETPISNNVDVGVGLVTGGLLQFPGQGHYALYDDPRGSVWFQQWLSSASRGSPVIVDVE